MSQTAKNTPNPMHQLTKYGLNPNDWRIVSPHTASPKIRLRHRTKLWFQLEGTLDQPSGEIKHLRIAETIFR